MFRVSGQRNKQKYGRVSSAVEKGKGLSSPSEKFLTFFFFCSRIIAIIEKFYLFPSSLFSFVRDSERKGGNLESIEKPVARELFADTCPWLIEHDITDACNLQARYTLTPHVYRTRDFLPLFNPNLQVLETF